MLCMRVKWFELVVFFLILCVLKTSADNNHCQVSDLPSCSINPNQDSCSVKSGHSRSTRAAKNQDYYHNLKNSKSIHGREDHHYQHDAVNSRFVRAAEHYNYYHDPENVRYVRSLKHQDHQGRSHFRSARAVKSQEYYHNPVSSRRARSAKQDNYEEPRYSRFGAGHEHQEHNEGSLSQQQGFTRPLYPEYDGSLGPRGSMFEEEAGAEINKAIPATPFFSHARYCPHCRKMLPPEPMMPHQPMDPRLFQQLQQQNPNSVRFFNHYHSPPPIGYPNMNTNLRSGTPSSTEEMCPYTNGVIQEQLGTNPDIHHSIAYEGYNQTVFQMPNSNSILELQRSRAASGNATVLMPHMIQVSAGPKIKHMKQPMMKEGTKNKEMRRSI